MTETVNNILRFVEENDIKFIRLAFCDLIGKHKNISIMPSELEDAFEHGISFDAHAIRGFSEIIDSDLFLFPDPTTISVLPWRPQQGRVARFYCSIKKPDGNIYHSDTRGILQKVAAQCEAEGLVCKVGAECEFYLFKTDENGDPTTIPFDKGGYFDVAPIDKGENIRREICLCLEEMGIQPETSHHEQGAGQNEIDFKFSDIAACADNFMTFKTVVGAIAARNGLFASFCPKPLTFDSGSGLHINLSLSKNGMNIFKSESEGHSQVSESFIAGILEHTREITAFLNPIPNSYERLGEFEAPEFVSWARGNRSQLVRIPSAKGDKVRMELRSPDSSANPYLAFALVLAAGLDGIKNALPLPKPVDINLYYADEDTASSLTSLPKSLDEALKLADKSDFVRGVLGDEVTDKYIRIKRSENTAYNEAADSRAYFLVNYFMNI